MLQDEELPLLLLHPHRRSRRERGLALLPGMNVKGLGAIVLAAILGVAGIAVYKKHGRGKEDDYVSEQLEFSDGPYVNEEEDEEEE